MLRSGGIVLFPCVASTQTQGNGTCDRRPLLQAASAGTIEPAGSARVSHEAVSGGRCQPGLPPKGSMRVTRGCTASWLWPAGPALLHEDRVAVLTIGWLAAPDRGTSEEAGRSSKVSCDPAFEVTPVPSATFCSSFKDRSVQAFWDTGKPNDSWTIVYSTSFRRTKSVTRKASSGRVRWTDDLATGIESGPKGHAGSCLRSCRGRQAKDREEGLRKKGAGMCVPSERRSETSGKEMRKQRRACNCRFHVQSRVGVLHRGLDLAAVPAEDGSRGQSSSSCRVEFWCPLSAAETQ